MGLNREKQKTNDVRVEKEKVENKSNDDIVYRRAKTWHIALSQLNSASAMCFYILIGYASYVANVGYGVATAVIGIILTATRIFDGITDPIIALLIDKTNTRFGKLRIFMLGGWGIEALSIILMYKLLSNQGFGVLTFILLYMLYVIGYTMNNMAGQIIGPVMTNDPKQRPLVSVWSTVYNYIVPMSLSLVIMMVILPAYGNEYTVDMLAATAMVGISVSFVLQLFALWGVSSVDKPENFVGIKSNSKEKVQGKDLLRLLKENRPLQMYIIAQTSDKLAQQTASQAIVTTLLYGILIGNMQLATLISMIAMLPSIIFAIIGAKYTGKHGSRAALVTWTRVCILIGMLNVAFFLMVEPRNIMAFMPLTILFFLLTLGLNAAKMCVTTSTSAMLADVIDYELERSGKYVPGAVTGIYAFIDKLVSSLGALIATGSVALIGYSQSMPQPTDKLTTAVFIMTMILYFGLPIFGWICTLVAMRFSFLTKDRMVEVQRNIQGLQGTKAV